MLVVVGEQVRAIFYGGGAALAESDMAVAGRLLRRVAAVLAHPALDLPVLILYHCQGHRRSRKVTPDQSRMAYAQPHEKNLFPEVQGLRVAPGDTSRLSDTPATVTTIELRPGSLGYATYESEGAVKRLFRILDRLRSGFAAVLLLIGALTLNCLPQSIGKGPHTVTLKQGQAVQMEVVKRLNSGRAQVGDDVVLKLSEPILAEGETVLPKGSVVHGRVSAMKRAAKNCQPGSIRWEVDPLAAPGDAKIEIRVAADGDETWRPARAARDTTEASAGEKATHRKGSSVGGILKGIAVVPLIVVAFPIESFPRARRCAPNCQGGKGREESFWKGKPFYAEVADDVQISVHGSTQGTLAYTHCQGSLAPRRPRFELAS